MGSWERELIQDVIAGAGIGVDFVQFGEVGKADALGATLPRR